MTISYIYMYSYTSRMVPVPRAPMLHPQPQQPRLECRKRMTAGFGFKDLGFRV